MYIYYKMVNSFLISNIYKIRLISFSRPLLVLFKISLKYEIHFLFFLTKCLAVKIAKTTRSYFAGGQNDIDIEFGSDQSACKGKFFFFKLLGARIIKLRRKTT